jgi:hypothetical protein
MIALIFLNPLLFFSKNLVLDFLFDNYQNPALYLTFKIYSHLLEGKHIEVS